MACWRASAPKKADAALRISLAYRSSLTSFSRYRGRWRWSVVSPGRSPASRSDWGTQVRGTTQSIGERANRRPPRRVLILVLEHEAHDALAHLFGVLGCECMAPILLGSGASTIPGR